MKQKRLTPLLTLEPIPLIVGSVFLWFILWSFTPGLLDHSLVSMFSTSRTQSIAIETLLALLLLVVLMVTFRTTTHQVTTPAKWTAAYAAVLIAAATLPLHYHLSQPLPLYILWMTASVVWQDYLTFGLLQKILSSYVSTTGTVIFVAIIFYLGHALFLPEQFGFHRPLAAIAILTMGVVFAVIRARTGSIHPLIALHLLFYFVFA